MRHALLLLSGLLFLTGSVFAKDAPIRTAEQRFATLAAAEEPSFRRHIVPLVSRAGCNGRECHGSFQGRGGFKLSLFGYDFEKDLEQMTVKADGDEKQVRINRQQPEKSLLLLKATNEEPHKGKERFKKGSWEYNMMLKWVQAGAKLDVEATGEFDRLEISPKEIVFKKPGEKVQVRVMAHWKDGTVEDVTQLTRFRSNDDSVSTISLTGVAESKDKGDTHIVAFYDNGVHPIPVMLPVSDKVGAKYPKVATPRRWMSTSSASSASWASSRARPARTRNSSVAPRWTLSARCQRRTRSTPSSPTSRPPNVRRRLTNSSRRPPTPRGGPRS